MYDLLTEAFQVALATDLKTLGELSRNLEILRGLHRGRGGLSNHEDEQQLGVVHAGNSHRRGQDTLGAERAVEGHEDTLRGEVAVDRGARARNEHRAARHRQNLQSGAAKIPSRLALFALTSEHRETGAELTRHCSDALNGVTLFEPRFDPPFLRFQDRALR